MMRFLSLDVDSRSAFGTSPSRVPAWRIFLRRWPGSQDAAVVIATPWVCHVRAGDLAQNLASFCLGMARCLQPQARYTGVLSARGPCDESKRIMKDWCEEILNFWFRELDADSWFRKDERVDQRIRERFLGLYEQFSQPDGIEQAGIGQEDGDPKDGDPEDARSHLAAVILLDQMPRNMFRGSPRAYAQDGRALSIAQQAIRAGLDAQLDPAQRVFLYMPFQHSEDPAIQEQSMVLFAALGDATTLDYARQHQQIIDRFGRFPHRNAILGRPSTPAELEFMQTHPGF